MQINETAAGAGSETKVVMRGAKSISGNNNALYVLDGIPLPTLSTTKPGDSWSIYSGSGLSGDGMSMLNSEDIADMSALVGASAAALYGYKAAKAVADGECDRGILICGTGIGIGIAAGKVKGIRVCTCSDVYSAELSKRHNNSNILTMGARVVGTELAKMIARHWLTAEFEGGRHQRRIDMIERIENGEAPEA